MRYNGSAESQRGELIYKLLTGSGGDPVGVQGIERYLKDLMPAAGRPTTGHIYENGPFSLVAGDIFSEVVTGGTPLMQWLPTREIQSRYDNIAHLEWVAPKGFDGSQTYADWLASVEIDPCGYGPSTSWSGFEYQMTGGSFSWTTEMMKRYEDSGIRYYEKMPQYRLRGENLGSAISDDREWAVARVLWVAEQHLSYVLQWGDRANSDMEWDGIDTILRPGYVQSKKIGPGIPHWADPIVVNAAALSTVGAVMQKLRAVVRRIRKRASIRNWRILPGDLAIVMSATMWDNIAESIAAGAMWAYTNTYGFTGQITIDAFENRMNGMKSGGFGFGQINIDSVPVPVLVDENLGMNVTIDPGGTPKPGVAGNIYVLTRRVNGMNILEQQYMNWKSWRGVPGETEDVVKLSQGFLRAGWVTEANKCYYYFVEANGRVVSYMQPMQAVIRNAVIQTLDTNEVEAGGFYAPDMFAYGTGNQGGHGTPYLTAA